MFRNATRALSALVVGILPVVGLSQSASAAGASHLEADTVVVYDVGGAVPSMTATFAFDQPVAFVRLAVGGLITAAQCQLPGSASSVSVPVNGDLDITTPIDAQQSVTCHLELGHLTDPAPVGVEIVVTGSDATNVPLVTLTQAITFDLVTTSLSYGPVLLGGAPYDSSRPANLDDVFSQQVTVSTNAIRSLALKSADPVLTAVIDCTPVPATTLTCTFSRSLTSADFVNGFMPILPQVFLSGVLIDDDVHDVPVFATRRIALTAAATPAIVHVGDLTSINLAITNQGSVMLFNPIVNGEDVTGLTACNGHPMPAQLVPGASVSCSTTRLATAEDVGITRTVTVRATSPRLPGDTDLVNDDPTSADDIDTATQEIGSVIDAELAVTSTLSGGPVWVGVDGQQQLTLTVDANTVGRLPNATLTVTAPTVPGATIVPVPGDTRAWSCIAATCTLNTGTLVAGGTVHADFVVTIDRALFPADSAQILTSFASDGIGYGQSLTTIERAVVTATFDNARIIDGGSDVATANVAIAVASGSDTRSVAVELVNLGTRGEIVSCTNAEGKPVALAAIAGGVTLGLTAPGSHFGCIMRLPITVNDRAAGRRTASFALHLTSGSATLDRPVSADYGVGWLELLPAATPAIPDGGYSINRSNNLHNHFTHSVDVVLHRPFNSPSGPWPVAGLDGDTCVQTDTTDHFTCAVDHAITDADLRRGSVHLVHSVKASGATELAGSGAVDVPTPWASLDVTVSEITTPSHGGLYALGDTVTVVVAIRNNGSMTLTVPVTSSGSASDKRTYSAPVSSNLRAQTLNSSTCGSPTLKPGELVTCNLSHLVSLEDAASGAIVFSLEIGGVALQPMSVVHRVEINRTSAVSLSPPIPAGGLPATGTDLRLLLLLATVSLTAGLIATRLGKTRPTREPVKRPRRRHLPWCGRCVSPISPMTRTHRVRA